MRILALASGGVFLLAAVQQANLPAPLVRNYANLSAAQSLTVEYTVRPIGEAPEPHKLELSRPNLIRLTTPSGYILSDGKTVTTYTTATKVYTQTPYTDAWATEFAHRSDVMAWGAFLLKDPASELEVATLGAARKMGPYDTDTVNLHPKKGTESMLFIDKGLGVARGSFMKVGDKQTLVSAAKIEVGKATMAPDAFAFVAPEGSTKEEPAGTFATVSALISDRCLPCHSTANHRGGVVLDTPAGVMATVTPGDAAGSLLVKSVKGDGVRKMPLGNHPALNSAEVKLIESWIVNGAKM